MATTSHTVTEPTHYDAPSARLARLTGSALLHGILILVALSMIVPFIWMISTSLKDFGQVFNIPPNWIPDPVVWENYPDSLNALPFGRAYWNSFYIAAIVVSSQLLTCSMAAYAFARIEFPFRDVIFIIFLATMMIPHQVTIIPTYLIMRELGATFGQPRARSCTAAPRTISASSRAAQVLAMRSVSGSAFQPRTSDWRPSKRSGGAKPRGPAIASALASLRRKCCAIGRVQNGTRSMRRSTAGTSRPPRR